MFRILKLGEMEPLNIGTFFQIHERIDFFPIYQRYGNIWSPERKRLLIDTLINGFDIPKFYFNYFIEENNVLNPKGFNYAVIDGKQRLQTILDFKNDKFRLSENFIIYDKPEINISNLSYSELAIQHTEIASRIDEYILDIVYVITDEEDKLEELFLRLNGGYALTNAEKRNAIGGTMNRLIRELVDNHPFFTNKLRFKNPRYQYQDLLTKLLLIENANQLITLSNASLEKLVRENHTDSSHVHSLIIRVSEELNKFVTVFEDKDVLLRGKGIIPVYYFFISRYNPNLSTLRTFIEQFENVRVENRALEEDRQVGLLIEFDRWNQQGVHRDRSLNERIEIMNRYYIKFVNEGSITVRTDVNLEDIEIENEDEF